MQNAGMHMLGSHLDDVAGRAPAVQSLIITVLHAERSLGDRIATCGHVAAYVERLAEIAQLDSRYNAPANVMILLPGVMWCLPASMCAQ